MARDVPLWKRKPSLADLRDPYYEPYQKPKPKSFFKIKQQKQPAHRV